MRPDRRSLTRILVAVAAVLALAVGYGAVRLKRYVDTDPGLCAQCHKASPEFALWNQGSHRTISCQRCHHATPEEGLAMLRAFLAGKPASGKTHHAQVEVGACATCHQSHDPKWPQIEGSRGHRVHVEEQKIECVRCHANAMHGFEPPTSSCQECHGEHMVRTQGMQQLHCFACHDFRSADAGLRPTRRDCLACHRAQGVHPARFAEDAPMQFACGECHHPHATSTATIRTDCHACHGRIERAGLHGLRAHQGCTNCHVPHLWRTEEATTCLECHGQARAHAERKACSVCHSFAGGGIPRAPQSLQPAPAEPASGAPAGARP
jgi:hypothetical protein